jgi:hypothetical protein
MGVLSRAKKLDDVVLGRSDSTRGYVMNAMGGLNPVLAPWWFGVAVVLLVAAPILAATGSRLIAVESLALALLSAAKGYVSRRLPRLPRD